jgi:multicomponent K+:H+ antiporter subunit D
VIHHLVAASIVLPLVATALLMLLGAKRRRLQAIVNIGATLAGLVGALELLRRTSIEGSMVNAYLASNWEAPFGIVLVSDRLSALMLVLVGAVSFCAALYAEAGWSRAGVHFHPLFQVALMGLNGAFLTGDLFNLFVFFEVLLAASYGLQLHGSGVSRVSSGLHYIAVNLLASSLFLIGLALLYGVMGTLSMADIAAKLPSIAEKDRGILHAGSAILACAFLIKAAIWPLNSWLVPAYTASSAPVAALFALMTKVGIYALLRLWTLLYSAEAGASAHFGGQVLLLGGLLTIGVGTIGLMGAIHLGRIASSSVIVSSGTLLAALGIGVPRMLSAALFYMVSATLAVSALFILSELVERVGADGTPRLKEVEVEPDEDTNLDDEEAPLVGRAFPVSIALLGLTFIACAVIVSGLPPFSGFIAKVSLLTAALVGDGAGPGSAAVIRPGAWWLFGLLLASGLIATVSLSRAGIRHFWTSGAQLAVRVRGVEALSVVGLLFACVLLTVYAERVLHYTSLTAAGMHSPRAYIEGVLSTQPRPGPTRSDVSRPGAP